MKTLFSIQLIILMNIGLSVAQPNDAIEWSEKRKLTVDDFKGKPPESEKKQNSRTSMGIGIQLKGPDIKNLNTFNGCVSNFFDANESWIDRNNPSSLQYINTIFDLYEWKSRELRKRYNENRDRVIAEDFQRITDEVDEMFARIRSEYDSASNYGDRPIGQMEWETRISVEIGLLAAYCKTCLP